MNPSPVPPGHVGGRRLALLAMVVAVLAMLIWFYVTKIQTGEVSYWYQQFNYEQRSLHNTLFYVWVFPWE